VNDGDARNPFKQDQKELFLDFLEEPGESLRRTRGDEHGIYEYYRVQKSGVRVLVVMMDVRYERGKNFTISEHQWQWLENVIKSFGKEDDLILIGSGI
jgi:hypothetical protein